MKLAHFIAFGGMLLSIFSFGQKDDISHFGKYDPNKAAFIEKYKDLAMEEMRRTGVPASVKLSQAIVESKTGKSEMAMNANNYFGMKVDGLWKGEHFIKEGDTNQTRWKKFPSVEDAFRHHSDNFHNKKKIYGALFELDKMDNIGWARKLLELKYMSHPQGPDKLILVMNAYNLHKYDSLAMGISPPMIAVVEKAPEPVVAVVELPKEQPKVIEPELPKDNLGLFKEYREGVHEMNGRKYVVARKGETAQQIAKRTKTPYRKIVKYNDLAEGQPLKNYQFVFIQKKKNKFKGKKINHQVTASDDLYSIAQYYGVTLDGVRKLNDIRLGEEPVEGEYVYLSHKSVLPPKVERQGTPKLVKKPNEQKKADQATIFDNEASPSSIVAVQIPKRPEGEEKAMATNVQKPASKPYQPAPGIDVDNMSHGYSTSNIPTLTVESKSEEVKNNIVATQPQAPKTEPVQPQIKETPKEYEMPAAPVVNAPALPAKPIEEGLSAKIGEYIDGQKPRLEYNEAIKNTNTVNIPSPKKDDLPAAPAIVVVKQIAPNHDKVAKALANERVRKGDAPVATPEMLVNSGVSIHTVKNGETLFGIARDYQTNAETLIKVNDLPSPLVKEGLRLYVPEAVTTVSK